jgi:hypothetical protein
MKFYKTISLCFVVLISIFSCQKIDKIEPFTAFYVSSFNNVMYADTSVNYNFNLSNGGDFELKLNFVGGVGVSGLDIYQTGISDYGKYITENVTQNFTVNLPSLGSKSGTITVSGVMDYSLYKPGIQSESNKYSFAFYVFDEIGSSRIVTVKFVKP